MCMCVCVLLQGVCGQLGKEREMNETEKHTETAEAETDSPGHEQKQLREKLCHKIAFV